MFPFLHRATKVTHRTIWYEAYNFYMSVKNKAEEIAELINDEKADICASRRHGLYWSP